MTLLRLILPTALFLAFKASIQPHGQERYNANTYLLSCGFDVQLVVVFHTFLGRSLVLEAKTVIGIEILGN